MAEQTTATDHEVRLPAASPTSTSTPSPSLSPSPSANPTAASTAVSAAARPVATTAQSPASVQPVPHPFTLTQDKTLQGQHRIAAGSGTVSPPHPRRAPLPPLSRRKTVSELRDRCWSSILLNSFQLSPASSPHPRLLSAPWARASSLVGKFLMSPRITRSSARQAASQAARAPAAPPASTAPLPESSSPTAPPPSLSRKRKVSSAEKNLATGPQPSSSVRRSKRQKIPEAAVPPPETVDNPSHSTLPRKGRAAADMDGAEVPAVAAAMETSPSSNTGSRRSTRSKRTSSQSQATVTSMPASRDSQHFTGNASDQDAIMTGMGDDKDQPSSSSPQREDAQPSKTGKRDVHGEDDDLSRDGGTTSIEHASYHDDNEDDDEDDDEDEHENDNDNENEDEDDDEDDEDEDENDDDPFGAYGGPGDHDSGLSSTLRALTGMMTGLSSRLRELLASLRSDDSSVQVIALQELSEIFLVSNEDNLSGHFSPDAFVKELVLLMSKEESPEIMLLACRCLANLMEALPASIANVVYGNAVPVLCQKLLEISFIDLAEQALSTLEKISTEYPSSIVREGGLTACLSYLDFFATSTQRTAVTTAANCCRNIPDDSFPVVKDVMPTLLNVLNSNDQRVVEQASLCVSGIVESFKYHPSKLEELISVGLLRAILRLLVPGTTNLIGPNIHTQFLRVLAFTARASPRLSSELFKLNVVETLYQILTGVSPPTGTEDVASKLDSVIVMQALIHRPREQIVEALNVICELLPGLPRNAGVAVGDFMELHDAIEPITPSSMNGRCNPNHNDRRLELLEDCKDQVRRFVLIIFPTLTDAFSSTINLSVRQKVLTAQIKMLSNLDERLLAEALAPVPYASFLASILSQEDHPSLVILGLQATELLLTRLDSVYRYQLYREGVIFEIQKLAMDDGQPNTKEDPPKLKNTTRRLSLPDAGDSSTPSSEHESDDNDNDNEDEEAEDEHDTAAHEHHSSGGEEEDVDNELNASDASPASSRGSSMSLDAASLPYVSNIQLMKSRIVIIAKKFLETHEKDGRSHDMRTQATQILETLSRLAEELEAFYLTRTSKLLSPETGRMLFSKLSSYFDTDILESITSAELLASGMTLQITSRCIKPPTRPPDEDKAPQPTLECADEKQLTDDDDDDDAGDSTALDAIVGELDEDIGGKGEADTSAVNLEVAAENTIVTRKEDNTRVATPPGANLHDYDRVLYRSAPHAAPHPSSRQASYSSILQTIPQDWHIEFTLDGKVIPNETTIYRAVHTSTSSANDHGNKNIWSLTHPIKFRRVSGQPPAEPRTSTFNPEADGEMDRGMAASLAKHPITASILQLLNILHDLNANIEDVLVENRNSLVGLRVEPLSQFVNTKLTAKLNRQLEEPLIVASSCLPSWSEDLARLYPFLFPFETRHLFLQSTSFGYARSMARWQNAHSTDDNRRDRSNERPFLGRLQRQKVRISRLKILESALKVMELYGASQSILEVEYFEEVGTGLGPTLEFYSTVSKEFSKKKLKLWREVDSAGSDEFVTGAVKIVDPVLARSLITIKKFVLAKKEIDEDPARTPAQKVADTEGIMIDNMRLEDLCLDFTLPGYPDIELQEHGSLKRVTIENVDLYLERVIDMTLGSGVKRQIDAFRTGFSQVFPYTALRAFTPDELVSLFGRVEEDWSLETLMDSIKADHGYNMDSRSVKNLLQTMSELDLKQRRDFLQFTTGSPKLPIGGKYSHDS
ncbi:hypothetical protein TrVFT333_007033 [Trichoderma virens FT-333]|nr:hypothetical protein TrVFT333_007033 [Trichoderma virens FT-333]